MNTRQDYSDAVKRFGLVAQQYCSLVDSRSALDKSDFLLQIYRLLPELVGEAIRLPQVEFGDDENDEQEASIQQLRAKTQMKQEEWDQLYNSLKEKLGDWDSYWQVFDPRKDNLAIHGSLPDDIADIYRELKDGIGLKEAIEARSRKRVRLYPATNGQAPGPGAALAAVLGLAR